MACSDSIWTSNNGVWTDNSIATPALLGKPWYQVASDSTGTKLVACENSGSIWTSNNGVWTDNSIATPALSGKPWTGVASDSTGTKLAACEYDGTIWTSNNGVWTDNTIATPALLANWFSVASDSTGTKLVACSDGSGTWTSNNGVWTLTIATNFYSVASDSTGTNLAACENIGSIWTSNNGVWTNNGIATPALSGKPWISIASNSNGTKLVACEYNVSIWTSSSNEIICFKEDTLILTKEGYKPIQTLRKGDLIKTLYHEYKAIEMIVKSEMYHEASKERIKDQLYKCSKENYPELVEDLIITGSHCILVDELNEYTEKTIELLGKIFITDNKYRLPACIDGRSCVYEIPGPYTIYHLSLENEYDYTNYGIYANGLLVESCSKKKVKRYGLLHNC